MWKWNNKKIAYASILVAASVSFVIVGSRLAAITTFPSFKVAFAGLPIKITGYLFGPLIGAVTGLIADILSFALLPTYYHPLYSLIMAMTGFIPGVIMWVMVKKKPSLNAYFGISFIILLLIAISTIIVIQYIPDKFIVGTKEHPSKMPIHNKLAIQLIASSGFFLWAIILVIFRVIKKWNKHLILTAPIILFCSLLEVNNSLLTPYADSLTIGIPFGTAYIFHMFTSPLKIFTNIAIVSITYRIIGPLVRNKIDNSY
ncbi:MAG: hypothetical protein GY679_02565 [Mycoplasma sp.]|nr:hypothetical protein [Mycoplasma sp.]